MKTAVITGATSGIGKAIAQYFAAQKWNLVLVARRLEILQQMEKDLPTTVIPVACDLSDDTSIKKATCQTLEACTSIDALVNNAGIFKACSVSDDKDSLWLEHFGVNLMGPVRLTRGLWPQFVKQGSGSIVNISSSLAIRPIPNTGAYSALKAALSNWTQTLALEGAPHQIRANVVSPGLVNTPIHAFHNSDLPEHKEALKASQGIQPLKRTGTPEDIAPVVFHLASENSAWTTGIEIPVDGGILLNS